MEILINNPAPLPYPSHADPLHYSISAAGPGSSRPILGKQLFKFRESNGTLIYQEEKPPPCLPAVVLERDQLPGLTKLRPSPGSVKQG